MDFVLGFLLGFLIAFWVAEIVMLVCIYKNPKYKLKFLKEKKQFLEEDIKALDEVEKILLDIGSLEFSKREKSRSVNDLEHDIKKLER